MIHKIILSKREALFYFFKRSLLIFFFFLGTPYLKASTGDTTIVRAHDKVDMTWYGNYDTWGVFPDGSESYNKIYLHYTMGCATGGCSDWDYTTIIQLLHKTGGLDSTIASIDTISTNPLETDTTWNVFDAYEPFELARVITPYGGYLSDDWSHTYVFDITDYYPLLKDSVQIRAIYSGYSSGFSVTTDFVFIEGEPSRKVVDIQNIYQGYFDYLNSSSVESNYLPAKEFDMNANTETATIRVLPSGHGFINSLNCAEFCKKDYYVKVNGQQIGEQAMWRDDCGLNPVWPQAGTWLYDRANWCPGSEAIAYDHDITDWIGAGTSAELDIDIESYSYTVPPGETPAGYFFTAQLIQYENIIYNTEAELDIIAPSQADSYGRYNPICGKVILKIRNNGKDPLTKCDIAYGIEGGRSNVYNWTGNLSFGKEEIIEIPVPDMEDWITYTGKLIYKATITNPNGEEDELKYNNSKKVSFTAPSVLPSDLRMTLRTNNRGNETFWSLKSADGSIIASGDNLMGNTTYIDTFNLAPGCYNLYIGDRGKDGLSFFANNAGNGSIMLRNVGGDFFVQTLNPDFGTEQNIYFTVGSGIGYDESPVNSFLEVYPNPSDGKVRVKFIEKDLSRVEISLLDLKGQVLKHEVYNTREELNREMDFSAYPEGIYILKVNTKSGSAFKKIQLY